MIARGYGPTTLDIRNAYRYLITARDKGSLSEWANSEVEKLIVRKAATGA